MEENKSEFEHVKKILKINFPRTQLFNYKNYENISNYIQNTLNPIKSFK